MGSRFKRRDPPLCVWDIRKLLQKLYEEDAIGFEIESDEDE